LIPFLSKEFSSYKEDHFLNLSLIVQDFEDYSKRLLNSALEKLELIKSQNKIALEMGEYQKYFSSLQVKVLEYILNFLLKDEVTINFNNFNDFQQWLKSGKEGKQFKLHPEIFVKKGEDRLIFCKQNIPPDSFFRELKKESEIYLADLDCRITLRKVRASDVVFTKDNSIEFIDAMRASFPLTLRSWRKGDHFKPLGLQKQRLVSDFLTDLKIGYPSRKAVVVLEKENEIAALPGLRISEDFKITDKTTEALKIAVIKS
jgi:tRNA(Ile)-lysidine synthase